MRLSDFDYSLPAELIAQTPLKERASSRLMVLNRKTQQIEDKLFVNLIDYLEEGDLLVLNNTRVIPARLFGEIQQSTKSVEVFLLKPVESGLWECLVKPGKKMPLGTVVKFANNFEGVVQKVCSDGTRLIKFNQTDLLPLLNQYGEMPLPPYIKTKLADKERYQTVFSDKSASVAAPTAGLHFTKEYLEKIKAKGIQVEYVTLEVGLGTFLPVKTENIYEHKMHTEEYEIKQSVVDKVNQTKQNGKKVVAVGTTSMRTLESSLNDKGNLIAQKGKTDIFIYPPYDFKVVDMLLTNFHLPKSTLLMLVSAFAGQCFVFEAYRKAIEKKYRFFSFGDAMLIV